MEVNKYWFINDLEDQTLIERTIEFIHKNKPELVNGLLEMAQDQHGGIGEEIRKVNRATCRSFWRQWSTKQSREDQVWRFAMESWQKLDRLSRWLLLYAALEDGKADLALEMVKRGAPFKSRCPTGMMIQGPVSNLFYGNFPHINPDQASDIGQAMLERGGGADINPSCISTRRMTELYIKNAPSPSDKRAWKHYTVFELDDILLQCMDSYINAESDRIIPLLEAGYPGDHVSLLAAALINNKSEEAKILLNWEGFDPGDHQREPTDWNGEGDTVAPRSFWHHLVERWNWNAKSAQTSAWQGPKDIWPEEDIWQSLLDCPWLDINQRDPKGLSALDKARATGLGTHPFEVVVSEHRRRALAKIARIDLDKPGTDKDDRNKKPKM